MTENTTTTNMNPAAEFCKTATYGTLNRALDASFSKHGLTPPTVEKLIADVANGEALTDSERAAYADAAKVSRVLFRRDAEEHHAGRLEKLRANGIDTESIEQLLENAMSKAYTRGGIEGACFVDIMGAPLRCLLPEDVEALIYALACVARKLRG